MKIKLKNSGPLGSLFFCHAYIDYITNGYMSGKKVKTNKPVAKAVKKTKVASEEYSAAETLTKILGSRVKIKCKNKTQKDFINLIGEKEIVIAAGPPGTGKSYLSIGKALELLQNKTNRFEKLIIIKPAVEAEENMGFLPGNLREKLDPYVASSIDIVDKIIGEYNREKIEEARILRIEGLGFLRGKTIDNAIVIIEEAQNISPNQMKTILTRIGENSKYVISGDLNQSDKFKRFTQTGLYDIFIRHQDVEEIGFFIFKQEDIVRNPLITKLLDNYDEKDIFNDASLVVEEIKDGFMDLTKEDDGELTDEEYAEYRKVYDMEFDEVPLIDDEEEDHTVIPALPEEYDEKVGNDSSWKKKYLKIKYRLYYFLDQVI